MATEKRLIYLEDALIAIKKTPTVKAEFNGHMQTFIDPGVAESIVKEIRGVDAVPVDDIRLHHILIDQNGIPEVKIQLGDRTLILRNEDEPVDVRQVVHGWWDKYTDEKFSGYDASGRIKYRKVSTFYCGRCGKGSAVKSNYCPNCGADMRERKDNDT